jgi:hypothetical protein
MMVIMLKFCVLWRQPSILEEHINSLCGVKEQSVREASRSSALLRYVAPECHTTFRLLRIVSQKIIFLRLKCIYIHSLGTVMLKS